MNKVCDTSLLALLQTVVLYSILLSGSLYNFYIIFLNSLISSFANVLSVVATKCAISDNLLYTTSIIS